MKYTKQRYNIIVIRISTQKNMSNFLTDEMFSLLQMEGINRLQNQSSQSTENKKSKNHKEFKTLV